MFIEKPNEYKKNMPLGIKMFIEKPNEYKKICL